MTINDQPKNINVKKKRGCLSASLIILLILILLILLAPVVFGVGIVTLLGTLLSSVGLNLPSINTDSDSFITDKSSYTATYERNKDKSSTITFNEASALKYNVISVVDSSLAFRCNLIELPSIKNNSLLRDIYGIMSMNKEGWVFSDYSEAGLLQAIENHKNYLTNEELRRDVLESYYDTYDDFVDFFDRHEMLDDILLDVYSEDDKIVTIFYVFDGHRGGVGWDAEEFIAFDKNTEQRIKASDILKNPEDTNSWDEILRKYVDTDNIGINDNPIPISDSFYFDDRAITFVYGTYVIAGGADGIIHITVPFSEISDYLKLQFIESYLSWKLIKNKDLQC